MGLWLTKHFSRELKRDNIQAWNDVKHNTSLGDWAEELILNEIINATFKLESPN